MSVQLKEENGGKTLEVHVSGKLSADDYRHLAPECDRLIQQHGKISLIFKMRDFHGWEAGALWQDIKFGVKHFSDIEKLAMVGDRKWEKWMSDFCRPFTRAQVRFFEHAQSEEAHQWIAGHPIEGARHSPPPIVL